MFRVAAIQMTSTPNRSTNLAEARHWLEAALDRRADFVAFPENFSLFTDDSKQLLAEAETLAKGVTVETLREWAAEEEIWILAGSIPLKVPGDKKRITNSSLLFGPDGEIHARYDKIHLFDAKIASDREYRESREVKAGGKPVLAKTPWGNIGLSICYDLRFPELYRRYAGEETVALFVPSAFTAVTGKAHWDTLTRARAIENQCYVVAPAQAGSPYPGRQTHGHSRIIDPWGRVIAERPGGAGLVWADLNPELLDRVREELPVLRHRKLKS